MSSDVPAEDRGPRGAARERSKLASLGEALPFVAQRFSSLGALGVVALDLDVLGPIEQDFGADALHRSRSAIGAVVERVAGGAAKADFLAVHGETGRQEVFVLLFRDRRQSTFYTQELPELAEKMRAALHEESHRVLYPFARSVPTFGVGYAAKIRNPHFAATTEISGVLEEARADAALDRGVASRERRRLLSSLVLSGRVTSVYEPIVDVETKTVFGYEALARGPVDSAFHAPLVLFEAAESENLVFELDCLCRESGLRGAEELPEGTKLFLNMRPTTIHDPNFRPEALIRTLERSGLRPADVVFEISEQESIQSFDVFREVRDEYGKLGFQFALDDTGAGYASLQAVLELAPDFIKVDRAFVAGIDQDSARQTLLRALDSVASEIGARIIAEGLDTLEELATLSELGIPFGQGWLFGKPTPLRADG